MLFPKCKYGADKECASQPNIQQLAKLRRGPHVFEYGQGYDIIQHAIGAPAADLMQSMARWEWKLSKTRLKREQIAREREAERIRREVAERALERHMFSDEALDAGMLPLVVPEDQGAQSQPRTPHTEVRPVSGQATASTTPVLAPLEGVCDVASSEQQRQPPPPSSAPEAGTPLKAAKPLKPLTKKFKVGKGDTLEMSKGTSFFTELDQDYEPHGFKLRDPALRPCTAMQVGTPAPSHAGMSYLTSFPAL